ncbi:MAG: GNAT family N-acetyltransferase [Jaaginema sp. PMC 1079.18]|nr:GNAT family N-acetyltransferase [Jaaginema sp. PMC 1080.18]MEC4852484.1 GNAT family N-acetyltransferase [Jaaginema sp. PMC 1079.18]MEC4865505.1 GNAT family N-acetyltransferase [Jaaginema sp. PMC 1078.18]
MKIRLYREGDIDAIALLYHHTVHQVNSRHYSPAQIAAWSPKVQSYEYWRSRLTQYQIVYVAEIENTVVGFTELAANGHIDCFYVHHQWQGCKVGSNLLSQLENHAKEQHISSLFAEVSITAQPFFTAKGFQITQERERLLRGQYFKQFLMEKLMDG